MDAALPSECIARGYRRGVFVLSVLALCMGVANLVFFPGLRPDQWIMAWSAWAGTTAILCSLAMGQSLLRALLPHILPAALTGVVFTGSVLAFGGTPLYLVFMWGVFLGLGILAARVVLPERSSLHGWMTLFVSLAASVGSFFVAIDPTLLAVFMFTVVPLATAWRRQAEG